MTFKKIQIKNFRNFDDISVNLRNSSMTLYKSKGLEFDQVVIFFEDYARAGKVELSNLNNHYVASTKAKNRLILVSTQHFDADAFIKN